MPDMFKEFDRMHPSHAHCEGKLASGGEENSGAKIQQRSSSGSQTGGRLHRHSDGTRLQDVSPI